MERGDATSLAISGALAAELTDDWTVTVSHDYGYNRPSQYSGTPTVNGRIDEALRKKNYNVLDADLRFEDRFTKLRSEEHTSELQSLMRISYAVFCLKKKK